MKNHIADGATKAAITLTGPLHPKKNMGYFKWRLNRVITKTKVTSVKRGEGFDFVIKFRVEAAKP